MEFFEAAADWAQRQATVVVFERDEFDGWYARVQMRDTNGPFSAEVNAIERTKGRKGESAEDFSQRVAGMLSRAVAGARKKRMGAVAYGKAA